MAKEQLVRFKATLISDAEQIKNALIARGIVPNKANITKAIKCIQSGQMNVQQDFFEQALPRDRETLAMLDFGFKKGLRNVKESE
jgi:hypothetical protein